MKSSPLFAAILILAIITVNVSASQSWWNTSWQSRQKLTFSNAPSEELADFPLLIHLNSTNFNYSQAKADGTDLRFLDSDGVTLLSYHIESWNDANNESFIWVKTPSISSTTDYIWLYYNNSLASDIRNEAGTYDSNYVGVWHLNGTSPDLVKDFTQYGNNGTFNGSSLEFDGVDDYVDIPSSSSLEITDAITVECWVYYWSGNGRIVQKDDRGSGTYTRLWEIGGYEGNFRMELWHSDGSGTGAPSADPLTVNGWMHLAMTFDGTDVKMYQDGVLTKTVNSPGDIRSDSGTSLTIGGQWGNTEWFNGTIDEVRIYNRSLSAGEVAEHYRGNFSDNSGMVLYLPFEEGSGHIAADSSGNGNSGTIYGTNLTYESAGYDSGNFAYIYVDGTDHSYHQRGHNIVHLDEDGNYMGKAYFDTYSNDGYALEDGVTQTCTDCASDEMASYLNGLSTNHIVVLAILDHGGNINNNALSALQNLGSTYSDEVQAGGRSSWGMISVVGDGKRAESYADQYNGPVSGDWLAYKDGWSTSTRRIDGRGKLDGADVFDGLDDYVSLPINSIPPGNELTFSLWAYGGDTLPASTFAIAARNVAGSYVLNVHLPWSNGIIYFDCGNDGVSYDRISKAADVADYKGRWTHWTFTKNATAGEMKIYKDGVLWHSGTGKTKPIPVPATVKLGSTYPGLIDEVRISNVSKSAQWINASYLSMTDEFVSYGSEEEIPKLSISLNSPDNDTWINNNTPTFNFTVVGDKENYNCTLFINGSAYGNNDSVLNNTPALITASSPLLEGSHQWQINCSALGIGNSSEFRRINIDTIAPIITFMKPSYDNLTVVGKWFRHNITVSDPNLYWLNCTIYNAINDVWWSQEWNLTGYQKYEVQTVVDVSSWSLGLYYGNCSVWDLTER